MKKYLSGMIAVVLAVSLCAFSFKKPINPKATAGEMWFVFNGTDPDDLGTQSKYSLDGDGSSPTVCTSTSQTYRCEVFAQSNGASPERPILNTIIGEKKRSTP